MECLKSSVIAKLMKRGRESLLEEKKEPLVMFYICRDLGWKEETLENRLIIKIFGM